MLLIKICNDWRHFAKSLAKVVNYFGLSKKMANFSPFIGLVYGTKCLLFGV